MKKINKFLTLTLAGTTLLSVTACRDKWTDENTPVDKVVNATPVQVLTSAEYALNPFYYTMMFYGMPANLALTQMHGFTGSYTESRILSRPYSSSCMLAQQRYVASMEDELRKMGEEEAAKYEAYNQAVKCLAIYAAILDSDIEGDIPYTEGGRALYGGPLKPAYDTVESLYDLWNEELKTAASVFANPPAAPLEDASQDIAFGADWNKWKKFANSLRVKVATRLIHRNLAKAKTMVAEAVAGGVMQSADDDLFYHKASIKPSSGGAYIDNSNDLVYGTGNGTIDDAGLALSEKVGNFLFANRDPRLRMQYEKNNWNAAILNWYLQNGYKNIVPPVVLERAEIEADGANFKFVKWKDEFGGNLWARYIPLPDDYNAENSRDAKFTQFYQYSNLPADGGHRVNYDNAVWSYRPYSLMSQKLVQTNQDFTVARIPGVTASKADFETDVPRYEMYMTAAEVQFYLAEFATYGGVSGLGAASDYFKKGVQLSVEAWDKLANNNWLEFYHQTFDISPDDVIIALQEGEVAALLNQPAYQLTGNKADDLEKIFLNLEIHFAYNPVDQYVTCRRSGIPKFGSNLIARVDYSANGNISANQIARRPAFSTPSLTDQMREEKIELYRRQGFTLDIQDARSTLLNTERLWQDVGAPQYGEGPNVGL